jgi:UDP-N-acetylglucosamine 2-epimerase
VPGSRLEAAFTAGQKGVISNKTSSQIRGQRDDYCVAAAGTARLVGTNPGNVDEQAVWLLDNAPAYAQMAKVVSPFGDGKAAVRIVAQLAADLSSVESACNGISHVTKPGTAQSA